MYDIPKYILIEMMGKMYIEEGKTAKEISDETGYSISTVRKYLSLGSFYKRDIIKINNDSKKEILSTTKYKKLDKNELLKLLKESQQSKY